MEPFFGTTASVSYQPHCHTTIESEDYDTDSIISLVTKLNFKISEENKQKFFDELEMILEVDAQKEGSENSHSDLINFFIKHASNGTIVA